MIATRALTIQPAERGGVLPYPWHLDQDGMVGRQDKWKGAPERLIGFVRDSLTTGSLDLLFADFLDDPQAAVGMYPVFEHSADSTPPDDDDLYVDEDDEDEGEGPRWFTYNQQPIAAVHDRTAAP